MTILRVAFLATVWVIAGCSAAGASDKPSLTPAGQQPSRIPAGSVNPGKNDLPASITDPVVAEIARVAGVPVAEVTIISAESVTFPDGSLGCPSPGMVYTQALVDGWKIVATAGGTTYDYRGSGTKFRQCTPAPKPLPSAS
jgi:hypothetical protein